LAKTWSWFGFGFLRRVGSEANFGDRLGSRFIRKFREFFAAFTKYGSMHCRRGGIYRRTLMGCASSGKSVSYTVGYEVNIDTGTDTEDFTIFNMFNFVLSIAEALVCESRSKWHKNLVL
jgi:hypothetical protein